MLSSPGFISGGHRLVSSDRVWPAQTGSVGSIGTFRSHWAKWVWPGRRVRRAKEQLPVAERLLRKRTHTLRGAQHRAARPRAHTRHAPAGERAHTQTHAGGGEGSRAAQQDVPHRVRVRRTYTCSSSSDTSSSNVCCSRRDWIQMNSESEHTLNVWTITQPCILKKKRSNIT